MKECLICDKNCSQIFSNDDGESSDESLTGKGVTRKHKPFKLLGKQLHVIFILKEIVGIGKERLEGFLRDSRGDNPEDWVGICGDCDGMVDKCRGYFEEMVQARRRFENIRTKIVGMVKASCSRTGVRKGRSTCIKDWTISETIKKHVIDCNSEHVRDSLICEPLEADPDDFHQPEYFDDHQHQMELSSTGNPTPSPENSTDNHPKSVSWKLIRPIIKNGPEPKQCKKQKIPSSPCENCELCGLTPRHLRSHQADAHNICSVETCKMVLENREELYRHQVNIHGKEIDVFKCDQCEKLYVLRKSLWRHKQLHEFQRKVEETGVPEGDWICDLCGKMFCIRSHLNSHKWQVHMKKRKKKVAI